MLIACVVATVQAAPASDFYLTLLRRGISALDSGRNADAIHNLRIAAFGFVDSLDHYQIAQTYLALAHSRLSDETSSREALRKLVAAERQNRRYGGLELPGSIRGELLTLAARLLTPAEAEVLRQPASNEPRSPSASPVIPPAAPTTRIPSQETPRITHPAATTPQPRADPPRAVREEPRELPPPPRTDPPVVKQPVVEQPAPRETPATVTRTVPGPANGPQASATVPPSSKFSEEETLQRIAAAERALNASRLAESRAIYRELLARGLLSRSQLLRVAEGLYRSRDFAPALEAFRRLGTLLRGEEPYRYYVAVALYETGNYAEAKETLRSALPFIEVTPDVARYQAKIEGAH